MGKRVNLAYGRSGLVVNFPDEAELTLIHKRVLPPLPDPHVAVRQALNVPIGSASLKELSRNRRSACILICDITRPVSNHLFLRPIIEDLLAGGVPASKIVVLVATGLHRPSHGAELEELIGDPWVLSTVQIANHMARDDAGHVDLGRTITRGTPIKIDRRFVEADIRIATGLVEPHFMAGYSGGRKVVAPGIAHADTIRTFHSARFLEDPLAVQCNLERNPLHEEQLEIIRMIGEVYALNIVSDELRQLSYVCFGEIIASHLAAVEFARKSCEIPVPRRFKTIVTSSAGYPLDKTYYQTIKGMVTPLDILEPGGTLILASACTEGLGSEEFHKSQRRLVAVGPDAFLQTILGKTLADTDEWETEMLLRPVKRGRVAFYTDGLSEAERRITGVEHIASVEMAVCESMARTGDHAVAVIPEGPYIIPLYTAAV